MRIVHRKALFPLLVVMVATPLSQSRSQTISPADSVCLAYAAGRWQEAVDRATALLEQRRGAAALPDLYRCQAAALVELGRMAEAREAVVRLLSLDPRERFSPEYLYPPPLLRLYHEVRDSLAPGTMDIRTIAVGDFEDNSVYRGKIGDLDPSAFGPALVHTVITDLAEATSLRIVDRQRTRELLQEIRLGQGGFADPQEAVRMGRLLGAHAFVFGQYMILSPKRVRIDARVVRTATGEIILARQITGDFDGDPEKFLKLERELVLSLAQGIEEILQRAGSQERLRTGLEELFARKAKGIRYRKGYVRSVFLAGEALAMEASGEYRKAKGWWRKALEADPQNEVARQRLVVLEPLL
jgi:TolB-like protein